jgi:hypothetical protein
MTAQPSRNLLLLLLLLLLLPPGMFDLIEAIDHTNPITDIRNRIYDYLAYDPDRRSTTVKALRLDRRPGSTSTGPVRGFAPNEALRDIGFLQSCRQVRWEYMSLISNQISTVELQLRHLHLYLQRIAEDRPTQKLWVSTRPLVQLIVRITPWYGSLVNLDSGDLVPMLELILRLKAVYLEQTIVIRFNWRARLSYDVALPLVTKLFSLQNEPILACRKSLLRCIKGLHVYT